MFHLHSELLNMQNEIAKKIEFKLFYEMLHKFTLQEKQNVKSPSTYPSYEQFVHNYGPCDATKGYNVSVSKYGNSTFVRPIHWLENLLKRMMLHDALTSNVTVSVDEVAKFIKEVYRNTNHYDDQTVSSVYEVIDMFGVGKKQR
jgi:hypothetical protein